MKKLLGIICLGVGGLVVSNAAFAQEKSMDIVVNVPSTYTVTIPANQEIPFEQIVTQLKTPLIVEGNIAPDKMVQVKAGFQPFCHQELSDAKLHFQLWDQSFREWKGTSYFATDLENNQQQKMFLNIMIDEEAWQKAEAGIYEGTIIFTSSIQDQKEGEDG